jgi:hypothetical protein
LLLETLADALELGVGVGYVAANEEYKALRL